MDSPIGQTESLLATADSINMRAVKTAFRAFAEDGVEAGVEYLLGHAHQDCEFRPYSDENRTLRGHDEVRAFVRDALASGGMTVRATSFRETGDMVVVNGTLRVMRPTGGLAESQISWTYQFRDGLVQEASGHPRNAAV